MAEDAGEITADQRRGNSGSVIKVFKGSHPGVVKRPTEDLATNKGQTDVLSANSGAVPISETRITWSEKYQSAIRVDKNGNVLEILKRQKP